MSIFDVVAQKESGNQNILTQIQPPGGGNTASGYYQITNPTWQDFAPRAGVNLAQYPTAMSAPADVQTAVASQIPLSRWAAPTQAAVVQQFGAVNPNETLGTLNAQQGGGSFNPGNVQQATLTSPTGTGQGTSNAPGGGTFGGAQGTTIDPASGAEIPPVGTGYALNLGLQAPLANFVTAALTKATDTITAPFKAAFATLENWLPRIAIIAVGLVLLTLALWHVMAPAGMGPTAVAKGAVRALV